MIEVENGENGLLTPRDGAEGSMTWFGKVNETGLGRVLSEKSTRRFKSQY
jgi:hypothetical protein